MFVPLLLLGAIVESASGACSTGWLPYGDACYYSVIGYSKYADAQTYCNNVGGSNSYVVTINSAGEQQFVDSIFSSPKRAYWLGMSSGSTSQWVDGKSVTYTNWRSGTPSSTTGKCVMASSAAYDGKWDVVDCANRVLYQGVICKQYDASAVVTTTQAAATTAGSTCVDLAAAGKASDCPQLAYLCNDQVYYNLMTAQCPYTCNRCPGQAATCVDLKGPDGTTDCPQKSYLCTNAAYWTYMTEQCPYTCNRCPPRASSGTCVDKLGPNGVTDCPEKAYLCNVAVYYDYMTEQCPLTCNRC